jgi:pyruvate/2-oxoglutarate/acetoin dehydrogenase E1 component
MNYESELTDTMSWLGKQKDTLFLGQSIAYPGNAMYKTLQGVSKDKLIEMPVAEDMQMGASIGLSLTGKCVISIFPRFDFLLCATNQLVNHCDKIEQFTNGEYKAHLIIRVGIGSKTPMYPGVQHCGDYTEIFQKLLKNIPVVRLTMPKQIHKAYEWAYHSDKSTMIVEDIGKYGME